MARMITRQAKGDGLLIHGRYGRRCHCADCWAPRVSRGSVRIVRHQAKRAERHQWEREELAAL